MNTYLLGSGFSDEDCSVEAATKGKPSDSGSEQFAATELEGEFNL
jgi:hypothetical protein